MINSTTPTNTQRERENFKYIYVYNFISECETCITRILVPCLLIMIQQWTDSESRTERLMNFITYFILNYMKCTQIDCTKSV